MTEPSATRTTTLTIVAMVAFAANSLLCRAALAGRSIDAASFTLVRIAAGALALTVILRVSGQPRDAKGSGIGPALALFAYAICFSFAYLALATGTGALVLFGAVQLTMIIAGVRAGERPTALAWAGMLAAGGGLVVLVLPGVHAPDPKGALLMAIAGVAWGVYSLLGRGSKKPLAVTERNFMLAAPLALSVWMVVAATSAQHATVRGVLLASASGALASGVGYSIWYAALRGLTAMRAAVVQLSVPVIAALSGVALLGEPVTPRLVVAGVAVLGGVAVVLRSR